MKSNCKAIAGWCVTPCSMLFYSLGSFASSLRNAWLISISAFAWLAIDTTCKSLSLTVLQPLQYGICKLDHLP